MKTGTIPDKCVTACVVDDDDVFRDIVGNHAGTLEGTVAIATGSWDGTTRKYVAIPANTDTAVDFGASNLAAIEVSTAGGQKRTVVILVDDYAANAGGNRARLMGIDGSSDFLIGKSNYTSDVLNVTSSGGTCSTSSGVSPTDKQMIAMVCVQSQNGPFYKALDTDSTVSSISLAAGSLGQVSAYQPRYIGRHAFSSNSSMNAKLYGYFLFNDELTSGQLDTLAADPWGTLFESGASAVAGIPLLRARMMNG